MNDSAFFSVLALCFGLYGCSTGAADSPLGPNNVSGGQTGDISPLSCSLEYDEMEEEKFALDAQTPLGVATEVIARWTLEGSAELTKFEAATSNHVPSGSVAFEFEPIEAIYASGTAPHDVCKLYEVLSIWAHVTVDLDGAIYENNGRVQVRPAGTISGSNEAVARSGELSLLELSCTSGCPDGDSLLFSANVDDSGRTLGFITRGSDELSFQVP